jgi:hypothetical protein
VVVKSQSISATKIQGGSVVDVVVVTLHVNVPIITQGATDVVVVVVEEVVLVLVVVGGVYISQLIIATKSQRVFLEVVEVVVVDVVGRTALQSILATKLQKYIPQVNSASNSHVGTSGEVVPTKKSNSSQHPLRPE